jgi:hypothetical protein
MKINNTSFKQVIKEETETVVFLHMLQERTDYLKSQGLNKQQIRQSIINESFLDSITDQLTSLWSMAPESIKQTVIEKVLEYIEGALGLNPKGWLMSVINKAVANMTSEDWEDILAGDCETISTVLIEALEEQLLDMLVIKLSSEVANTVYKLIGIRPDNLDSILVLGPGRALRDVVRNELFEWIKKQKIVENITNKISEFVCKYVEDLDLFDTLKAAV